MLYVCTVNKAVAQREVGSNKGEWKSENKKMLKRGGFIQMKGGILKPVMLAYYFVLE